MRLRKLKDYALGFITKRRGAHEHTRSSPDDQLLGKHVHSVSLGSKFTVSLG